MNRYALDGMQLKQWNLIIMFKVLSIATMCINVVTPAFGDTLAMIHRHALQIMFRIELLTVYAAEVVSMRHYNQC